MAYNQPNNPFKFGIGKKYQKEAKKSKFGIGKESRFEFTSRKRKEAKDKDKRDYEDIIGNKYTDPKTGEVKLMNQPNRTIVIGKKLLNSKNLTDEEKAKLRAKLSITSFDFFEPDKQRTEGTNIHQREVYNPDTKEFEFINDFGDIDRKDLVDETRYRLSDVASGQVDPNDKNLKYYGDRETIRKNKAIFDQRNTIIPSYLQTTDNTPSFFYKRRNKRARTMRGFRMKRNRR